MQTSEEPLLINQPKKGEKEIKKPEFYGVLLSFSTFFYNSLSISLLPPSQSANSAAKADTACQTGQTGGGYQVYEKSLDFFGKRVAFFH